MERAIRLQRTAVLTQFSIATNEYIGQGKEKAEYQYKGTVYDQRDRNQGQFIVA